MSMILSFSPAQTRIARPARSYAASGQSGIMVGLLVAMLLAAPFWLMVAYLARNAIR